MKHYSIHLSDTEKELYPAHVPFGGTNNAGETLSLCNYYAEKNGRPFFMISGEFHFSRYDHRFWEDEIIKMKMAGINTVSFYIFWNHHEEEEGVFNWEENKNVRTFIKLCHKHGLYAIIRIGPFAHGEVRNGGLPDWLFGRPFELRDNNDAYLYFVRRLYREIGSQIKGFLYKDGGPVIGTQLENEMEHAAAPWEMTTGTSNEWASGGQDGAAHLKKLKQIAREAGIVTPFYTATAWGGASAPTDTVLPLWGGYAYWPWIFYKDVKEHPATPNYVFRDYHNNRIAGTFDFEPQYESETLPFACAEMGGGMTVFYGYRFILPYESVDAMSAIKVAGGCNFIGYYMFHGGSNPKGKTIPFLNETVTPKISYDYQAPIGEFGQIRDSYKRLKRQHYFYQEMEESFAKMKTVLPEESEQIAPHDVDTLRYAVRASGNSGFVFINNFQDHVDNKDLKDMKLNLQLPGETITIPAKGSLAIAKNENCILPFHFSVGTCRLYYATTQLLNTIEVEGETFYFFFIPEGMQGQYAFDTHSCQNIHIDHGTIERIEGQTVVHVENTMSLMSVEQKNGKRINVCTMTSQDSLNFWKFRYKGREQVFLTDAAVMATEQECRLETDKDKVTVRVFPGFSRDVKLDGKMVKGLKENVFEKYVYNCKMPAEGVVIEKVTGNKAVIRAVPGTFNGLKELLLHIDYEGDIGYAFINGDLVHDNYGNHAIWEIGLKRHQMRLLEKGMYIYISPLKKGVKIKSDSPMAARTETSDTAVARIHAIRTVPVQEIYFSGE